MLLYIRIQPELKRRADRLVERGLYPDFNSAAATALENLVLAEEEQLPAASPPKSGPAEIGVARTADRETEGPPIKREPARIGIPNGSLEKWIVPYPADLFQAGDIVPAERWIFGQQNRVFPAKVNARIFLNLLGDNTEPKQLSEISEEISKAAASVYLVLHELDQENGHNKDDSLATAFPEPGSDKSIARYANQFVGYENTQGRVTGMMIEWKLAGIKRIKNKTYLYPTIACVEFAQLKNPLLDLGYGRDAPTKFSDAELSWAINHISTLVPVESSAFRTLLSGIMAGATTPDSLDKYIRSHATQKASITDEFVSTQRTGALSRMADIGLVRRVRNGTRISYDITERGRAWITQQLQENTL
jgi:hypothetical protein